MYTTRKAKKVTTLKPKLEDQNFHMTRNLCCNHCWLYVKLLTKLNLFPIPLAWTSQFSD